MEWKTAEQIFKATLRIRATQKKVQWNMAKIQKLRNVSCFKKNNFSKSKTTHSSLIFFTSQPKVIRWYCRPKVNITN